MQEIILSNRREKFRKYQLLQILFERVNWAFTNYINKILDFFDHLLPCVYILCGMNIYTKWTF